MGGPTYTKAEVARIRREYETARSVRALAAEMGRTPEALKQKALELGLHRPRTVPPGSPRSVLQRAIVERYATAPDLRVLAVELGTTFGSLKGLAYRLGVRRDPAPMDAARRKGSAAGVAARQMKRRVSATPLDAAWRGLL